MKKKNLVLLSVVILSLTSCATNGYIGQILNRYKDYNTFTDVLNLKDKNGKIKSPLYFNSKDSDALKDMKTYYYAYGFCSDNPIHSESVDDICHNIRLTDINEFFVGEEISISYWIHWDQSDTDLSVYHDFYSEKSEDAKESFYYFNSFNKNPGKSFSVYKGSEEITDLLNGLGYADDKDYNYEAPDFFLSHAVDIYGNDGENNKNPAGLVFSKNATEEQIDYYTNAILGILNK